MPDITGFDFRLSSQTGGMIIYHPQDHQGATDTIWKVDPSREGGRGERYTSSIVERTIDGEKTYAAVFPCLPAGDYDVPTNHRFWNLPALPGLKPSDRTTVTVFPGHVVEVDGR